MISHRSLILAVVGTACVAATAAGGFLALRMNNAEQALATVGAPNAPAPAVTADTKTPAGPPAATETPAPPAPTRLPARSAEAPIVPVQPPLSNKAQEHASSAAAAADVSQAPTMIPAPPTPAQAIVSTATISPAPPAMASPVPVPAATAPFQSDLPATAAQPVVDPESTAAAKQTPRFEEMVLAADSVIGIRLESTVSSQTARVEDKVTAVVTRDVTVAGRTAIPAGTKLDGVVQSVEAGGNFKNQARLGIRFNRVLMPDNSRVAIQTDTIFREGDSPTNEAVSKVGASTVVGSILGALIGGKKGAAIGAGAGAAGGTAAVAAGAPNAVIMLSGTLLTVRLTAPVNLTVEKHE